MALKMDQEISENFRQRFERFPWYQRIWREIIYWILEYSGLAMYSENRVRRWRKKKAFRMAYSDSLQGVWRLYGGDILTLGWSGIWKFTKN